MGRYMPWLVCLIIGLTPSGSEAGAGQTGLSFLKLGVGARAAGFGGAYTAIVNDATALYWNPAGMTAYKGTDAAFIYTQWFQDISHQFVGAVTGNGDTAFGLGFVSMTVEGIERRTGIPTEQPLGTFDAHDLALSGSVAHTIRESLSLGFTTKMVSEKILFDTATTIAFDVGLQYRTPYEGIIIGGSIRNIGPDMSFIQEKFPLPREIRIGMGYAPQYAALQKRVLLSVDVGKYRAESTRLNFGGEYTYQERVSAVVGYQARQDETGFTTGFGLYHRPFRLHYAFVPFGADLGNTHRFAIGVRF